MGWRQLRLPVIIITHCTRYPSSNCFCFTSASTNYKCLCFRLFFLILGEVEPAKKEKICSYGSKVWREIKTLYPMGYWVDG